MDKNHQKNILLVKSLVDDLPVTKRIELYRWLGELAADPWVTKQLHALADDLSAAEKRCQEFDLSCQLHNQRDGK